MSAIYGSKTTTAPFKIGDTAVCTKYLRRRDGKAALLVGGECTITAVWIDPDGECQIVGLAFDQGRKIMGDVVVRNDIPLKHSNPHHSED